jgi:hypothetical protein
MTCGPAFYLPPTQPTAQTMKTHEFPVPLAALSLPGEGEGQTTSPAEGDTVDITGTARVVRIEGDRAIIAPASINGQDIAAPVEEPTLDEEETALRRQTTAKSGEIY